VTSQDSFGDLVALKELFARQTFGTADDGSDAIHQRIPCEPVQVTVGQPLTTRTKQMDHSTFQIYRVGAASGDGPARIS
jgi:hypothetical protein